MKKWIFLMFVFVGCKSEPPECETDEFPFIFEIINNTEEPQYYILYTYKYSSCTSVSAVANSYLVGPNQSKREIYTTTSSNNKYIDHERGFSKLHGANVRFVPTDDSILKYSIEFTPFPESLWSYGWHDIGKYDVIKVEIAPKSETGDPPNNMAECLSLNKEISIKVRNETDSTVYLYGEVNRANWNLRFCENKCCIGGVFGRTTFSDSIKKRSVWEHQYNMSLINFIRLINKGESFYVGDSIYNALIHDQDTVDIIEFEVKDLHPDSIFLNFIDE